MILAAVPKLPSSITKLLRPAFIGVCILNMRYSRFYKLGSTKYHLVNLVYYTLIYFAFPITPSTTNTYISIMLFVVFFILSSNREWTRRELIWILVAIVVACDIKSILTIIGNPDMLRNSGTAHMDYLGTTINRNSLAFAAVPGALCSMFLLLYDRKRSTIFKDAFYLISCLICSFVIFALACRSAFLSAAVGLACILWQKARDARNAQERFNNKLLVVVLALLVLFASITLSQGTFASRLFEFGEESNDSGRDVLWEAAWELIDEKPVFGGGFDYWTDSGQTMGTHNAFLTFMVSGGWVAGILLGWFFLQLLLEVLKSRNLIPLAFMAELLLHSWTEPGMDYYAYIPLILTVILLRYLQYKSRNYSTIFM